MEKTQNFVYRPRVVDQIIRRKLRTSGAVLVDGPKWCGKTTTAEQIAKSALKLGRSKEFERANLIAINDIDSLLDGETPRLIDEWQVLPKLWDTARSEIDDRGEFGQFIFTGSSTPNNSDQIQHSGTGRFARVRMRTMSLSESGESNNTVSLADLFDGRPIRGESALSIRDIAFLCCRGGFPAALKFDNEDDALATAREYVMSVAEVDLSKVRNVKRNPEYVRRIMCSYARHQGEQVALTEIVKDIESLNGEGPSINTVTDYVEALRDIFVIEDVATWNPNLRSKTAIRTSDTRYYVDPSIAAAALEVDPDGLMADLNTFGFVFETLCMRDLRVYADALDGKVSHYRDSNGLECDAVVHLYGGKYGFVQMKLGGSQEEIEDAAKKMKDLANIIDTTKQAGPEFMMVLTGAQSVAYRREDGVYVVPVGCLKP